jgi:tRNA A-37 threonylcarbamoyl transferase component Bud32
MSEVGQIVGGTYKLLRPLGKGGWGAVYEAEHLTIGKRVAIKVLKSELTEDEGAVRRFVQEARAAAAIRHRSIIDIYDIHIGEDDSIFLVMELLEGESLGDLLHRERRIDVPLAAYVMCQILSALDAVHRKGIIHRDLKPDNIFLVRTGLALPEVKLLDFGVSKILYPDGDQEGLTRTGALVGTPHFMAPEQAVGRTDVDHRADLYALGVILYRCLTGEYPFTAPNVMALVQEILNAPVTPPKELRPDLPEPVERVLLRAMARERDHRYREAAQLLAALLPFLDETAASQVPLPEGIDRWREADDLDEPRGEQETLDPEATLDPEVLVAPYPEPLPVGGGAPSPTAEVGWPTAPRWRLPLGIAVVLVAAVAVAFVVMWPRSERGGQDAMVAAAVPATSEADASDDAAPRDASGASSEDVAALTIAHSDAIEAEAVVILLEGVPEGATVMVEGVAVDGPEIRLPRSTVLHEVRVELVDHRPWRQMVRPDRDRSFQVLLERARPELRRPPASVHESPAPEPSPNEPLRPPPPRPREPGFDEQFPSG